MNPTSYRRFAVQTALFATAFGLVGASNAHATSVWAIRTRLNQAQCVDVVDESQKDGAGVQLWPCNGGDNQSWTFDGQAVRIYGDKCLDVVDGRQEKGVPLQVWGCKAPNAHQRFERFGNLLRWVGTNLCLDVVDGRTQNGGRLQLWTCSGSNRNQAFAFVERDATPAAAEPVPSPAKADPAPVKSSTAAVPTTLPAAPEPTTAAAAPSAASLAKLQSAGTFLDFPYIALANFLNLHPVLKTLRQDILDAAASVNPPLPPILLAAIAMEESSGNPTLAGGLMQFTWAPTWAEYGRGNILNGRDSLFAAARYMTDLLKQENNDLAAALRAYNGNANSKYVAEIKSWLSGGFPYGAGT